jgi:hypothetical protein
MTHALRIEAKERMRELVGGRARIDVILLAGNRIRRDGGTALRDARQ